MTYDKTNRGTLNINKRKKTDQHPSHCGELDVRGEKFFASMWPKINSKTGEEFFSVSLRPWVEKPKSEFDDEIPND